MFTQEQLDAKIAEAVAAATSKNNDEIAALKKKAAEHLDVQKKAQAHAETAREEAEKAAAEAAAKAGDIDALKSQHAKELKKLTDAIASSDAKYSDLVIDRGIQSALTESGIAPQFHTPLTYMLKAQTKLDGTEAKIGELSISDHVKAFVASAEGKHYVAAPINTGSGATGSSSNAPLMTKENFSLTKIMEVARTDPQQAKAMAEGAGYGDLFS